MSRTMATGVVRPVDEAAPLDFPDGWRPLNERIGSEGSTPPTRARRVGVGRLAVRTVSRTRTLLRRWRAMPTIRRVLRSLPAPLGRYLSFAVLSARNDLIVLRTRSPLGSDHIVKIARRAEAGGSLDRHDEAVRWLRSEPSLTDFVRLVPEIEMIGSTAVPHRHRYLVEGAIAGVSGETLVTDGAVHFDTLSAAIAAIGPLHTATAQRRVVDAELLAQWVDEPLRVIVEASGRADTAARAGALQTELEEALLGRTVSTSAIHGDFTVGNLLYSSGRGELAAMVDWEAHCEVALPEIDLVHLIMSARLVSDGLELDEVIPALATGARWRAYERLLIEGAVGSHRNVELSARVLVILAWLAHASGNVVKARQYRKRGRWMRRNVDGVLAALVGAPPFTQPSIESPAAASAERVSAQAIVAQPTTLTKLRLPAVIFVVGALWIWGLNGIDLTKMSDTGLVSILRPPAVAALAVLTVSFMATVLGERPTGRALGAHIVTLIGLIHATPALLYGTLKYSWAWKHVAIVDYITRHHGVDPHINLLQAYHNWPGFFALASVVSRLFGFKDVVGIAMWAPLFFNLLNLGALLFLYSTLTTKGRVVWTACWIYFVANWVGQDYFAPQALAFVLYLIVLGVIFDRYVVRHRGEAPRPVTRPIVAVIVGCTLAIVTSHQLTPMMLVAALVALTLTRRAPVGRYALFALGANLVWFVTGARAFVGREAGPSLRSFGALFGNADRGVQDTALQSSGQAIVSLMGRMTCGVVALLAIAGFVMLWRRGQRELAPAVLAVVPAAFVGLNDYGGEILFRAFLFSCPFLAYFAAHLIVACGERRRTMIRLVASSVASCVLLSGFLFGYYGKDRQYHFTADEVAATAYVIDHSAPKTLLVSATFNYPNVSRNYERFKFVVMNLEDVAGRKRIVEQPASVLASWIDDPRYSDAFILLTRSQAAEIDSVGVMPTGSVEVIERALRASPRFKMVFSTPNAQVFTLAER